MFNMLYFLSYGTYKQKIMQLNFNWLIYFLQVIQIIFMITKQPVSFRLNNGDTFSGNLN